jgi:CheY-like chemotaxis protein
MTPRILVVDDSKLARLVVAKALKALHPDWPLVEAATADEALLVAKQSSVDVAIVDFNMPGRDGLSVAADLLAWKPKLPLAILSANTQMEVIDGAHKLGARFLFKPLLAEDLGDFLDHAISLLR